MRVALSALLLLTACGGAVAPTTVTTDDAQEALTSPKGSHKKGRRYFHYAPSVESVVWRPGCGVPTDPPCPVGAAITFTASYSDLQTAITSRIDDTQHTLTLIVDSFSTNDNHPRTPVSPETRDLGSLQLQFGTEYAVSVLDYQRRELWTGTIFPALAP